MNSVDDKEALMDLGFWEHEELNGNPDQFKRQLSAAHRKLTPFSIDTVQKICYIKGSGKEPYIVSLNNCTCSDFSKRKLPCKHMYRLTHELGLFALPKEVESKNYVEVNEGADSVAILNMTTGEITQHKTFDAFLDGLLKLSEAELIFLYAFANDGGIYRFTAEHYDSKKEVIQKLMSEGYIVHAEMTWQEKIEFFFSRDEYIGVFHELAPDILSSFNPNCKFRTYCNYLYKNFPEDIQRIGDSIIVLTKNPAIQKYLRFRWSIESLLNGKTDICIDEELCLYTNGPSFEHLL